MLADVKLKVLEELIKNSSNEELIWMNGYLNGIVKNKINAISAVAPAVTETSSKKITIVYGTETGNSKKLATDFAAKAKQNHVIAKVVGMDQYRLTDLTKEEYLLAVISTHGEGEPPAAAKKFYDHIHNNGFKLEKLKYSVLALGDTSYPLFCKTGEDVDEQLSKLGGNRIVPLQKCDVEYDEEAKNWIDTVLKNITAPKKEVVTVAVPAAAPAAKKGKQTYTGKVITKINLNDRGSNKETYHVEIEAEGLEYQCGDSIGIVPENDSQVVTDIIALTNVDGNKSVEFKKEKYTIYELLKRKINIFHLTERLIQQYATTTGYEIPHGRADLLDILKAYPVKNAVQFEEILVTLNAISPRLYTIASSPAAHDGEVHIVVVKDTFIVDDKKRFGLCSNYISQLKLNSNQHFFVQPNKRFRLPAENKDIIMVGPGTGIAAFRSFLAERDATGATGRKWLFFGEQYFATDFLYQTEIQNWHETGVLTKVNLAFSRDQKEKIYVQHKMLQHGAELYEWLKGGASFFVCGKKHPMSNDVEHALLQIIEQHGNKTAEEAKQFLHQMEEEGRYEKDVY
jgi:sulfite reductase (NADPH) flavoprotein alpha-component